MSVQLAAELTKAPEQSRSWHCIWLLVAVLLLLRPAWGCAALALLLLCASPTVTPRLIAGLQVAQLISRLRSLRPATRLSCWAQGCHLQTLLFAFRPQGSLRIEYHREMVRCSDGGVVALDWLRLDRREADTEAIVLHLPGKVGKYGNRYISRAAEILPFRSVVKSWRGICCDLAPESPRTETWDQRAVQDTLDVARHLKRCYPHAPLLLLGWSHGGNVALAALAQGRELFSAGLVVSAPSDLSLAIPFVEGRQWFPYAFANALAIVKEMREPNQQALAAVMPQVAERINTVKDQLSWRNLAMHFWVRRGYGSLYHDLFTRYFSKHDSVSEYLSSLGEMVEEALPKIAVPTLCLLSEDDPVTPALSFSHLLHHGSASVAFAVTKSGGHCGWFCGWSAVSWANEVALEFFQEVLQKTTPSQ